MADFLLYLGTNHGVVTARRDQGIWHEVDRSLATHDVTCIAAHQSQVLAGTRRGILHSDDQGHTWRLANHGLDIEHIRWLAYHPAYPSWAYAGTEPAAIFVTRDGSRTWETRPEVIDLRDTNDWFLPYSPEAGCVRGFAFHGERAYAAVEQGGLLRSDDRGEQWRLVDAATGDPKAEIPDWYIHPDVHSVAVHPSSPDLIVAPTGGGLYRSEDGGRIWTGLYRCYCRAAWTDPKDPEHMILGPADGVSRRGRIEETVDGGESWRPASAGLDVPWPQHMVERFTQIGDRLLAVLSNGELLETALHIISWQHILPQVGGIHAAAVVPV